MPLTHDLLQRGYLPENMTPCFTSIGIAEFFSKNHSLHPQKKSSFPFIPAKFNGSKRGQNRRDFTILHPSVAHELASFVETNWECIDSNLEQSKFSLSIPSYDPDSERALNITSHNDMERIRLERLSGYRFIVSTDISRFYHSIYTHSLAWAFHGKETAKNQHRKKSSPLLFDQADSIIRRGQDRQSVGIPVGPDVSRVFAEIVATGIDNLFSINFSSTDYTLLRHVDDVWIGTNSRVDAEQALSRYREAVRHFELDINQSKTKIYESDFRFTSIWPSDIGSRLDHAIDSSGRHLPERLRTSLEYAFALATEHKDDGVLRYVIRYLDTSERASEQWSSIEPFLKRCLVHFGHTVDYVLRVVIWRHLVHSDLDVHSWSRLVKSVLLEHGRLGNDSEVCWCLYGCQVLNVELDSELSSVVIRNCGPMPCLALLNCADIGIVDSGIFGELYQHLNGKTCKGPGWPILLEWSSKRWPQYKGITLDDDEIKHMASVGVVLYDINIAPTDSGGFVSQDRAFASGNSGYEDHFEVSNLRHPDF